jgi:hypothetical protein
MENFKLYAGVLGGVFALAAYVPYVVSVVKKETNPVKASWITWTLSTLIILLSSYAVGVRNTIWLPLAYATGCTVVTLLSFKYGSRGWSGFDKVCMAVVLISIGVWYFFNNPLLALLLNISIDLVGYLPTLKKLIQERSEQEDVSAWGLHVLGAAFSVLALPGVSVEILYPLTMFVMDGSTFAFSLRNKFLATKV